MTTKDEYLAYLDDLFDRAWRRNNFDVLCTLLRVGGWHGERWDPFEESIAAFDELNWLMAKAAADRGDGCAARVALLMYCQAIEMTAPHVILANLLRIVAAKRYVVDPFADLIRRPNKNNIFVAIPPSAKKKFGRIQELARTAGDQRLEPIVGSFLDDRVRNAFSHSDYVLTDDTFRWTEGGLPAQITREELNAKLQSCSKFYGALLGAHRSWLRAIGQLPRFHQLPGYEVLEIVRDEEGAACGFKLHFSNGELASYRRTRTGSEPLNVVPQRDGTINFFCGVLSDREAIWKVNGVPVTDWDALEKLPPTLDE
jgi:hypothetical protein